MEVNMRDGNVSSDPWAWDVLYSWQNVFKGLLNPPQTESLIEKTNTASYMEKKHIPEYLNNDIRVSKIRTKLSKTKAKTPGFDNIPY